MLKFFYYDIIQFPVIVYVLFANCNLQIPESAVLHFGEDKSKGVKSRYPIVTVKNVTIFPGVPHLLERAFALLGKVMRYIIITPLLL